MQRDQAIVRIFDDSQVWDIIVIGGGATGVGAALDAASRGYRCALLEQSDFGKATSSRSTKLVHGGVRYLRQGRLRLVAQALRERNRLRHNAPHLVHDLPFVVPIYQWWQRPCYAAGLAIYGSLSGPCGFGRPRSLTRTQTLELLPGIRDEHLAGGILYHDGQFDDARLLINLAQTAAEHGAAIANYVQVIGLVRGESGTVRGVVARDLETAREMQLRARCVVNATGAFCDSLRLLDDQQARRLIAPSQGSHIVLPARFLPGNAAMMIPRTSDRRLIFAIPWHGHVLVGTTDIAIDRPPLEPAPLDAEIDFLLHTLSRYLGSAPTRADILSTFAGVRPLVGQSPRGARIPTARLSRDHFIEIAPSGLVTITGGKWTTYRAMAQECIDAAARVGGLPRRRCVTKDLPIHGWTATNHQPHDALACYGADASAIGALASSDPALAERLCPQLSVIAAQVVWAAKHEAARTVEDVLARRTRALHLNARAAIDMAPAVAELLARTLGRDCAWVQDQIAQFRLLAQNYLPTASQHEPI
ncbi:glycerol-3-phosphate dehydrogenase/oxidase [Fontivita pretiosa]|uniref:glycerol-3-phosphate dehydrogenase/oxidase n=1 Tax=Fontivita pretiosa TaxID=2989684 RepID=UPI003D164F4D